MQALEALTRLIALSDWVSRAPSFREPRSEEDQEADATATAICQAILNTALPVARFRAFVQIDNIPGKQDGREFTVCAVSIAEVQAAIRCIDPRRPIKLQATLWEQEQAGAEMLSGYQGPTGPQYRKWLDSLSEFQSGTTVN